MKKLILIIMLIICVSRLFAAPNDALTGQTAGGTLPTTTWKGKPVKDFDWVLVYSPILMLIIGVFAINMGTKKFKLEEALTENDYPKITEVNPQYDVVNLDKVQNSQLLAPLLTPTIQVSDTANGLPKSSSRYLALITTTLSLTIAACLTSLFIYIYMSTGAQPDISHLGDVLVALGIGVTPYAFNKVSAAVSTKQ